MFNLTTKNEAGKISGRATNPNREGGELSGYLQGWAAAFLGANTLSQAKCGSPPTAL